MAVLHVKSPNGTTHTIDLTTMNVDGTPGAGWTKFQNGLIIQWGHGAQTETDIVHPIRFTTIKSCALAIHIGTDPTPNIVLHNVREVSTDISYFITDSVVTHIYIAWMAIGY